MEDPEFEKYCQSVIFQISQYIESSGVSFEPILDIKKQILRPREIDSFTSAMLGKLRN